MTDPEITLKLVRGLTPVAISLIILIVALFVILSDSYDSGNNKWAYGAVGSIFGYWTR